MFGKKCTLCGGKLDSQGICTECGLDNTKSDGNYRLNESSCDGMPLTHVHESDEKSVYKSTFQSSGSGKTLQRTVKQPKMKKQIKQGSRQKGIGGKKGMVTGIVVVVLILTVIIVVQTLQFASDDVWNDSWDDVWDDGGDTGWNDSGDTYEDMDSDPYEYLDEELPAEGDPVEISLPSGQYIAGIHIPAGYYEAEAQGDFDTVEVWDDDHGIYLYEYEGKEGENYLDDLKIFPGALITVTSETPIKFVSENAQTVMSGEPNPLTESCRLTGGETLTAGEDFEPGSYDLIVSGSYGEVDVWIYDEDGEEIASDWLYMGTDASDGTEYRNLVLPEGAQISCDSELELEMRPGQLIESTDYIEYYEKYY